MLDPFAQLFQNCWSRARLLRMVYKDLWVVSLPRCTEGPNIVGSCCIRLHTTANTHATTPNIVVPTMLGVVASVCTQPQVSIKRCRQKQPDKLPYFHLISRVLNFDKSRNSEQTNSNNRKNNFIVNNSHPGDPGAVSRVERQGATKVLKYGLKSPWVPNIKMKVS